MCDVLAMISKEIDKYYLSVAVSAADQSAGKRRYFCTISADEKVVARLCELLSKAFNRKYLVYLKL